jgi:hypothetical protein
VNEHAIEIQGSELADECRRNRDLRSAPRQYAGKAHAIRQHHARRTTARSAHAGPVLQVL